MNVTLLYFDSCPHWHDAAALIDRLATQLPGIEVHHHVVDTDDEAQRAGFIGSPTILIDDRDPWAPDNTPTGLSCRIYPTPHGPRGTPTWEMLLDAAGAR